MFRSLGLAKLHLRPNRSPQELICRNFFINLILAELRDDSGQLIRGCNLGAYLDSVNLGLSILSEYPTLLSINLRRYSAGHMSLQNSWLRLERRHLVGQLWLEREDLGLAWHTVIISERSLLAEAHAFGLPKPAKSRILAPRRESFKRPREDSNKLPNSSSRVG